MFFFLRKYKNMFVSTSKPTVFMDPNCWTLIRKYLDLRMKILLEPLRWSILKKLSVLWGKYSRGLIKHKLNSINIVGTLFN